MIIRFKKKLRNWQEANIITDDQAAAILAYERSDKQKNFTNSLTYTGIFAILLGVVSIVAANWQAISPDVKIAGHFILNLALAVFITRTDEQKHPNLKEGAVLVLFGLFLTFIALIGQTYQLHGDLHNTLLFWLGICTPFLWMYGRTYIVAGVWLIVALSTLYLNLVHYIDFHHYHRLFLASLIGFYLPPALLLIGNSKTLRDHRPGFVTSFKEMGIYLPALFTNIAIFLFYMDTRIIEYSATHLSLIAASIIGTMVLFRPKKDATGEKKDQQYALWLYLVVSGLIGMLPFAFPDIDGALLPALIFIGYWLFLGWLGTIFHNDHLIDWAIKLIVLRIFIVYLEVFGGLMLTGFGLIFSGIILLIVLKNLGRIVAFGRKILPQNGRIMP